MAGDDNPIISTPSPLEQLPPELLQEIFKMLKPEDLQQLRLVSKYLKACVDNYVTHLMQSGAFMSTDGTNLTHWVTDITPSKVLTAWKTGNLLVTARGLTPSQILDTYDRFFAGDPDTAALFNELWRLAQHGEAEGLADSLLIYIRELTSRGRLVATATGQAFPPGTPVETVLNAWRKGDAAWQRPL